MRGGCLCGRVRYELLAEPTITAVCHCTHCQRQSGSAFSVILGVPSGTVELTGEISTFHDTGDSGAAVARNFCPQCGSPVTSEADATADLVWVKAGTLDDPSGLRPTVQIYCDSAQPWVKLDGLEAFGRMPEK